ncbi:MAG: 4a-hydroxytetrahydrobiopterin dehydratase [Sulfuricaulis sp.]
MTEETNTPEGWGRHERPPSLFRRFQFGNYSETRAFLDRLETLSKEVEYFPDISFGTTYANVTVHARNTSYINQNDIDFAQRTTELAMAG